MSWIEFTRENLFSLKYRPQSNWQHVASFSGNFKRNKKNKKNLIIWRNETRDKSELKCDFTCSLHIDFHKHEKNFDFIRKIFILYGGQSLKTNLQFGYINIKVWSIISYFVFDTQNEIFDHYFGWVLIQTFE